MDLFIGFVALFFFYYYFLFFYFNLFYFNNLFFKIFLLLFFLSFFLPFILSCVADRVLVLQPGVRPEPLEVREPSSGHWTTRDLEPHVVSVGENSPRDLLSQR